jgi:pyrroloquinoline-quinone synthase
MTTLTFIDEQIADRSLLTHPFYQAWTRGELTADALKDYAIQYYRHVEAFPTYLSALHAHTSDAATRRQILQNLMDEEAGSPNHPELWMQFAGAVGASDADVKSAQPWKETKNLVEVFSRLCRDGSTAEGLAALYSYESQIPAVAASKIDGLKRFYGKSSPEALAYFVVHEEADREHSATERRLLEQHISTENGEATKRASAQALDALWKMLSGVCRRHGMSC